MRKVKLPLVIFLISFVLSACASHPDPIIDMKGVNPEQMERDWEDCEGYTEQIKIEKGVAKGAAGGAAVGGATGAIGGDGAAGAGYGAIFGAARSGLDGDREK